MREQRFPGRIATRRLPGSWLQSNALVVAQPSQRPGSSPGRKPTRSESAASATAELAILQVIDTNILVYAHDKRDATKQRRARALLAELARAGTAALPAQALDEFSSVMLRRLRPPAHPAELIREVEWLMRGFAILPLTLQVVVEALRGVRDHGFGFYDAQIWGVARLAQATVLLSEDFPSGEVRDGVRFINPFD